MDKSPLVAYKAESSKEQANKVRRLSDVRPGNNVILSIKHLKLKAELGKLWPQYVGPSKVLQIIRHNTAKLELPLAMKVYPVLNIA